MKKILKYINILIICIFVNITSAYAEINGITLKKSESILGVGYTENLKYDIPSGLNSSNIIWRSSNQKVATVNSNGKVTGIATGTTIITASLNGYTSTCTIVVSSNYIPVNGISLNKSNLNLTINSSEKLTSNVSPSNASNKDVTWRSSNNSVATVDSNGKITAKKIGTTIITVSSSGYTSTCTVNVVDTIELKGITINKTTLRLKEKNSETLKITFNPSNATNKKITWKSSNSNIATVDNNGTVKAIKPGSATITAVSNDGGYVATSKVTVEALSKKVTGVSLDKKEIQLVAGEEGTLKATINPSYAENKNIKWESSNEKVATVKDGVISAKRKGTTEIKVITEDGEKEAICKVTVTSPPIKSISFKEKEKTIYVGNTETLLTVNEPTNSEIDNPIWTSSDEKVVKVENGKITGLKVGESTITVSNKDKTIQATINIKVIKKPVEKLNITIDGYNLNFDPSIKNYKLKIGSENQLKINVNKEKYTVNGNQKLKDGSIITITVNEEEKVTYVINIKKKTNYTIYFIIVISLLLLLNLIRMLVKSKKKKR